MLTSRRTLARTGTIAGAVLVMICLTVVVVRSHGSTPAGGQTTSSQPCRAGLSLEALYETALRSQAPGRWDRAIACAQQISTTQPGYKQTLFVEAWALWNSGRRSAATRMYQTYLQLHPEDAQGWLNLAFSRIVMGDCKGAAPALATVLRLQPASVAAVHDLVVCGDLEDGYAAALRTQSTRDFASALAQAKELSETHPTFRNILFLKAWAQWNLGRRGPAISTYQMYLSSHPTDVQAQLNLGAALISVGRCTKAIPFLQTVLTLQPTNHAGAYDLALCGVKPKRRIAVRATPTAHR